MNKKNKKQKYKLNKKVIPTASLTPTEPKIESVSVSSSAEIKSEIKSEIKLEPTPTPILASKSKQNIDYD